VLRKRRRHSPISTRGSYSGKPKSQRYLTIKLLPMLSKTDAWGKSETQEVLKKFLKRVQNEFDAKVKRIRNDNGTEFKNTQVEDFLDA
jgi:hypothetical protein